MKKNILTLCIVFLLAGTSKSMDVQFMPLAGLTHSWFTMTGEDDTTLFSPGFSAGAAAHFSISGSFGIKTALKYSVININQIMTFRHSTGDYPDITFTEHTADAANSFSMAEIQLSPEFQFSVSETLKIFLSAGIKQAVVVLQTAELQNNDPAFSPYDYSGESHFNSTPTALTAECGVKISTGTGTAVTGLSFSVYLNQGGLLFGDVCSLELYGGYFF